MHTLESLGECPICGDELYSFRTKSRKRLVKCINENCPKQLAYGLPKSGNIEVTGLHCPKNQIPLLAIIPNIFLKQGTYKSETKKTYFWAQEPCFSCSKQSSCAELLEAMEDYEL